MNQSAIRSLCSCVVLAGFMSLTAIQAQAGTSLASSASSVRELEQNIRQRGVDAHKEIKRDAIKHMTSKEVLMSVLKASLNQDATVALNTVAAVREPSLELQAD